MEKSISKVIIGFLFCVYFNLSCTEEEVLPAPNIVWITSEDNSKHYLKHFDENGVETPNIEWLAKRGLTFTRAFSNAPVCSVARSTLISGCYGPRVGSQFHRKLEKVPMPEAVQMFPAYLREAGYHTTNNSKEDYNFTKADNVWDESSRNASWKDGEEGQPFFHVFNIGTTHESRLHFNQELMDTVITKSDPRYVHVMPQHPSTDLFKYTNAYYRDKIQQMDGQIGEVLNQLREDDLMENTIIFYYGDHGGVLPGSKGYLYETGLHIPLVVYIPKKYQRSFGVTPDSKVDGFVSFVDFAPTVLSLAGVALPKAIDGNAFLGKEVRLNEVNKRDETFGYADRFDEKYDFVRSIRKGKYKYIRNFQPFNFDGLMNNYRYIQMAYAEWLQLYDDGELNEVQAQFFQPRPAEQLFNLEEDPYETRNLALDSEYSNILMDLRQKLMNHLKSLPDLSFYPEHHLINNAFNNPVNFGQEHKEQIASYVDVANLSLSKFDEIKTQIENYLKSADPWTRYWALVVCSSFGSNAKEFESFAQQLSNTDPELLNRVRAAEFLGLIDSSMPSEIMTKALYESKDGGEALLILNSIVLMQDGEHKYKFNLNLSKIDKSVQENSEVRRRLTYLGVI